jgi:membrane protease subunit HflK
MAWNEPGNSSGKRNPWERRPGKNSSNGNGVNDLLKQFKKTFSSQPGGGSSGVGAGVVSLLLISVLLVLWGSSGVYQIPNGQVAVVTRFGKFQRVEQAGRGIRLPWPMEEAQLVNAGEEQHNAQLRVLTTDEAFVDVVFVIKYRRTDPAAWVFNMRDPESALNELGESAIREVFGHETMATLLVPTRQMLATRAGELMRNALDTSKSGVAINGIDVIDVRVPSEVKPAQEEVTKAQTESNSTTALAREYASNLLPTASGDESVIREKAEAYKSERIAKATGDTERFLKLLPEYQKAPAATRERLYIETMQDIYSGARKVFVDGKGNDIHITMDKAATPAVMNATAEAKPALTPSTAKGSH